VILFQVFVVKKYSISFMLTPFASATYDKKLYVLQCLFFKTFRFIFVAYE